MNSRPSKKLEIEDRRVKVAAAIKGRASYREIAKLLNCSIGTVASDYKAILKEWRQKQFKDVSSQALVDLEAIDDAIRALMGNIRNGDVPSTFAFVKLLERRAKILGYEAPRRHEVAGPNGGPVQLTLTEFVQQLNLNRLNAEERGQLVRLLDKCLATAA